MRQNKNTWVFIGGWGLDRTDEFQKCCGSGLDRMQFSSCYIRSLEEGLLFFVELRFFWRLAGCLFTGLF